MAKKKFDVNFLLTIIFAVVAAIYMYPIVMVVFNSLKVESAISTGTAFRPELEMTMMVSLGSRWYSSSMPLA